MLKTRRKKKQAGRPPLPADERRANVIKVQVTNADKADFEEVATAERMSASTWLWRLGLAAVARHRRSE